MIKKIHQILPNFSRRDAVGTDTFLMRNTLRELGFESDIFYEINGDREDSVPLAQLNPDLNCRDTALIFHFSIGSDFPGNFVQYQNKKIVRYHNITPPDFFAAPGESHIRAACARGRQQIPMLAVFSDLVLADSAYNAAEFSYYSPIPYEVVPIFRDYGKLHDLPSDPTTERHLIEANRPVVLFVGRVCPNKAQHDLLKLITLYKATFQESIGLVLVGGFFSQAFQKEIEDYARYLNLSFTHEISDFKNNDILISGSISDEQLATFYRKSDVFCSLSDHEGFGVPLVEAMRFRLPIIAHPAAAVPETVGLGACLVNKSNWVELVGSLHKIIVDRDFRESLMKKGLCRADELSLHSSQSILRRVLQKHEMLE